MGARVSGWVLFAGVAACTAPHRASAPPPREARAAVAQSNDSPDGPSDAQIQAALGPAERFAVELEGQPCRGPSDAAVTIVEFGDYGSPFVRRIQPTIAKLRAAARVRHCFRHFPVVRENEFSGMAAEVGEEIFSARGSDAFWRYHETLMSLELDGLTAVFKAAEGYSQEELQLLLTTKRRRAEVAADEQALGKLQRRGVPSVFINGRAIAGAVAHEEFARVLDEELAYAQAVENLGLPAAKLYPFIVANAKAEVAPARVDPFKPSRIEVEVILLTSEGNGHPPQHRTRDEARQLAREIQAKLEQNADFTGLVQQFSNASDAHLGPKVIVQNYYSDPALNDAAFSLQPGQITGPIESKSSFVFIKRVR